MRNVTMFFEIVEEPDLHKTVLLLREAMVFEAS